MFIFMILLDSFSKFSLLKRKLHIHLTLFHLDNTLLVLLRSTNKIPRVNFGKKGTLFYRLINSYYLKLIYTMHSHIHKGHIQILKIDRQYIHRTNKKPQISPLDYFTWTSQTIYSVLRSYSILQKKSNNPDQKLELTIGQAYKHLFKTYKV